MAENQEVQESVLDAPLVEPYESEGARYLRIRAEAKEQAAVTMAAEAKAAQSRKAKRLRGQNVTDPEVADFNKRAAEVERQINAKPVTEKKEG